MDTLTRLAKALGWSFCPLASAYSMEGGARDFLERLGLSLEDAPPEMEVLREPLDRLLTILEDHHELTAQELAALLEALASLFAALRQLDADPPPSIPAEARDSFVEDLVSRLLTDYLSGNEPQIWSLLTALGVATRAEIPASGSRLPFIRHRIAWRSLPDRIRDPIPALAETFGWRGGTLDWLQLLRIVVDVLMASGVEVTSHEPAAAALAGLREGALDPRALRRGVCAVFSKESLAPQAVHAAVALCHLPETDASKPGFALVPILDDLFRDAGCLPFGYRHELCFRGDATTLADAALAFRPGSPPELIAGLLSGSPVRSTIELSVELTLVDPDEPFLLLGSPEGSRFELAGVSARLGTRIAQTGGREAYAEFRLEQGRILVRPEPGLLDGFLAELIPDDGLEASASVTVGLSSARGLTLDGSTDLATDIPVNVSAGPVEIHSARLAVRPADQAIRVALGAGFSARLGDIVTARVDRFGVEAVLSLRPGLDGNLGPLDYRLDLYTPDSISLTVDAAGALSGGGLLYRDPDRHLYAGVLQLSLQDRLTLKAVGLIATRLPNGESGYSLLAFITAEGFQPIPLGMGFTLQGIGGLVAINRSFDADALRGMLQAGGLAQLLFPPNPAGNPQAIVRAISSAFPARLGCHLLGLMARIGWFSPNLVTIDLALIQELGARHRLLALGRIQARLPSEENDLVRLSVEAVGVLDFDEGRAALDAVLTDSRLCQRFPITGEAAVRARFGSASDAHFVLAVGGLHPRFTPPGDFPPLQRAAIALCAGDNPRLVCRAYFAITSNTLQFGAQADLYVGVGNFSLTGAIGFDVLVQLVPLHFVADYRARLQLKRGRHNLFGVELAGELEGPRPLRIGGRATFKILWFHYSVRFDTTLVGGEAPPPPAAIDATARLIEALSAPSALQAIAPSVRPHGVSLRRASGGTGLPPLDPLGQLSVQQQVLPLNTAQDLELFDGAPIAGARRFAISAELNGARLGAEPLEAPFAPAQYFRMSDDERLAAPPYEPMQAGCRFGGTDADFDARHLLGAPIQYRTIALGQAPAGASAVSAPATAAALSGQSPELPEGLRGLARGSAGNRLRRRGLRRQRDDEPTTGTGAERRHWALAPLAAGEVMEQRPDLRTWSDCHAALRQLNREGTRWHIVRAHELESGGIR